MSIKNIICRGIGFSPGSVKFMPTFGFSVGATVIPTIICLAERRVFVAGAIEANTYTAGRTENRTYTAGAIDNGVC